MATITKKKLKEINQIDFAIEVIQQFEEKAKGSADAPNWYDCPPETWSESENRIWDMCYEVQMKILTKINEILEAKNFIPPAELKQALVSGRSEHLNFKNKPEQEVEEDDLLNDCIEYAKVEGKIRRGTLQRKFKLGYFRAGRIMAQIEAKGILGEVTGRYDNDREVCF